MYAPQFLMTKATFLLSATSLLSACVIYPHSVPVNPLIEGNLLSAESDKPVTGAQLTLEIGSDISRTYKTRSDTNGRFAFAAHSDFRMLALLADAPACSTVLSIEAPGYKPRRCIWMSPHWCNWAPALAAFKDLKLIPQHMPNDYAEIQAASDWPCNDPTAGMHH
ncbi:carboxypeptidase-like regulatory domain-containing protein [Pseudomonas sp.]|uniref:carboxypeptidase-like regulatory domain-containing protein n=1 Tax=Pseudomonas sp. TaxID=306 RepID=UPI002734B95C|nr:carboxypeptidase-like regulatory domain-containing protein [Pseudomonas sp.]MDP3813993.1 carboxypeptidase-like regulatory domain-containing protein [Pseudomonas sp.]